MAAEDRRPWIDWIHTALVQGNLVRDFVKWDDQPASHLAVIESLVRGVRIATTQPEGPVYVCLDAGLMEAAVPAEDASRDRAISSARTQRMGEPPVPPAADATALATVARALRDARWPLVVTGRTGHSDRAFHALTALATRWAIPVVDLGDRLNFPSNHEMNLTAARKADIVSRADVIVFLDCKDLAGPLMEVNRTKRIKKSLVQADTRVFELGLEDYATRGWIADYQSLYPTALTILSDTTSALPVLDELLGEPGAGVAERRSDIAAWHKREQQAAEDVAQDRRSERPIALPTLAGALGAALDGEDFVIANGELGGYARRLIKLDQPRQHLGASGGGGLGYGIGATIGASLACTSGGRFVVDLQGDGDLMMAPGGLWTLARYQLPALVVVNNNRSYYNDEEHQIKLGEARGRGTERAGIGTRIESPYIDFARLAESQGVEGIGPVDRVEDLETALARAIAIVRDERRPVLIDVLTQPQPR